MLVIKPSQRHWYSYSAAKNIGKSVPTGARAIQRNLILFKLQCMVRLLYTYERDWKRRDHSPYMGECTEAISGRAVTDA